MQFSIHQMGKLAPEFIQTILDIDRTGFDCDYISERLLMGVTVKDGMLQTKAGICYRGLIIPGSGNMPQEVKAHIEALKAQGAHILYNIDARELNKAAKPEPMKATLGLKAIRRKNATGYHYFIANLSPDDICENICLAVPFTKAAWFNPLNGDITPATITGDSIYVNLRSGASMILQTYDNNIEMPASTILPTRSIALTLTGPLDALFHRRATQNWKDLQARQSPDLGETRRRQCPCDDGNRRLYYQNKSFETRLEGKVAD